MYKCFSSCWVRFWHLGWGHLLSKMIVGVEEYLHVESHGNEGCFHSLRRIRSLLSFPNRTESESASWEHILLECFSLWVQVFKFKPFVNFIISPCRPVFFRLIDHRHLFTSGQGANPWWRTWVKNGIPRIHVFGCEVLVWCDEFSSNDIGSK